MFVDDVCSLLSAFVGFKKTVDDDNDCFRFVIPNETP